MIELSNIHFGLDAFLPEHEGDLIELAASACGVEAGCVREAQLLKRSVDARKKSNVHFVCTIGASLQNQIDEKRVLEQGSSMKGVKVATHTPYRALPIPDLSELSETAENIRPVVIGSGPAGLFAALYLAKAGMRPLLLERGASVEQRAKIVDGFFNGDKFNPKTNVQFGEGGAGTFSDGKLTTNTKNPLTKHVLRWFVDAGAPEDILYLAKPHIGTDKLRQVVRNMRAEIERNGGEALFLRQVIGIERDKRGINNVRVLDLQSGEKSSLPASHVVLACGHSARDTFEMIRDAGIAMERKPFSMGVRIEHLQSDINRAQYGDACKHPALGAADYKLSVHLQNGRGVYTFCMCPGGVVVPASSEEGGICVNGMSYHARDGLNSNAALLVGVDPSDFSDDDDVLAGVRFQQKYEQAAFMLANPDECKHGAYAAPAQTVGDFISGKSGNESKKVSPSYSRGVRWTDLRRCLPSFVANSISEALPLLDRKLKGFADPESIMTGVETRSSSPVRVLRGKDFQAVDEAGLPVAGLYPCGEGPGYAGGIMSAAVDGLRVAQEICLSIQISQAAQALREGKCALFPTDTVFGLGVSVMHADSPKELFEIKHRPVGKPVAWLVRGLEDLDEYGLDVPEWAYSLANAYWPGALTLIVKASAKAPRDFISEAGTIGLRAPRCKESQALLEAVGGPIATTSSNISGLPPAKTLSGVPEEIKCAVTAKVQDISEPSGLASTVVDCTGARPKVLRTGVISSEEIGRLFDDVI